MYTTNALHCIARLQKYRLSWKKFKFEKPRVRRSPETIYSENIEKGNIWNTQEPILFWSAAGAQQLPTCGFELNFSSHYFVIMLKFCHLTNFAISPMVPFGHYHRHHRWSHGARIAREKRQRQKRKNRQPHTPNSQDCCHHHHLVHHHNPIRGHTSTTYILVYLFCGDTTETKETTHI